MSFNVLIVDDEEEIRDMLGRHFRLLGYEILKARNGKEALQILSENRIEAVITDIIMPEMDGIELLQRLKEDHPMIRIIVMTGYVTLENALACMRHGAETIIFKPLEDLTEMEDALNQIVEKMKSWQTKLRQLRGMKNSN
jgi:YesN/AraC family two-component response regulator